MTGFIAPTGATGSTVYNVWGDPTSKSVTWNEGGTNKTITETAVYDGWGHMTQSVDANGAQIILTAIWAGCSPARIHFRSEERRDRYQYNTANQLTQMTYPSGRVINLDHDNNGRTTSVGSYVSSVTYNGIGQMTGTTLGNGVTEGYGYDANRMQLTSQKAGTASPYTNRMDLTYGYSATAGQMGVQAVRRRIRSWCSSLLRI